MKSDHVMVNDNSCLIFPQEIMKMVVNHQVTLAEKHGESGVLWRAGKMHCWVRDEHHQHDMNSIINHAHNG